MPEANPADVRGVIETDLDDTEIGEKINDAEFEASDAIDDYTQELDAEHRRQLEKYLAALRIVETKGRRASSSTVGDSSITYEASTVKTLRGRVHSRDPSNSLAYNRDDGRNISTT